MTEFVVVSQPQAPRDLERDHAIFESGLVVARPNPALIERQLMVETGKRAARSQQRQERQHRQELPLRTHLNPFHVYFALQSTRSITFRASAAALRRSSSAYESSDSRLGPFHALTYGVEFAQKFAGHGDGTGSEISVRAEYYRHTFNERMAVPAGLQ